MMVNTMLIVFDDADGVKMAEINVTGARYEFTPRDYTDNKMFQTALKRRYSLAVFVYGQKVLIKEFTLK